MGCLCNCVTDTSNRDTLMFNTDKNSSTNRTEKNEKLKNINNAFNNDPQYEKISKDLFNILNDIRINPDKYIRDSKDYSLMEVFIKLKKSTKLLYSENNINDIKKYLINSYFKKKSIFDQENELKLLINDGDIDEISLFQIFSSSNDINEIVWTFLLENEDDFGKIFDSQYNYLMIICFPLEYNTKILISLIFYKA